MVAVAPTVVVAERVALVAGAEALVVQAAVHAVPSTDKRDVAVHTVDRALIKSPARLGFFTQIPAISELAFVKPPPGA